MMAWRILLAIAALGGCTMYHISAFASQGEGAGEFSWGRRAASGDSAQTGESGGHPGAGELTWGRRAAFAGLAQAGESGGHPLAQPPLWILPGPPSHGPCEAAANLEDLEECFRDDLNSRPFWWFPPAFVWQVLKVKEQLVRHELSHAEDPARNGDTDAGAKVLAVILQAYAQLETPFPAVGSSEDFGLEDVIAKVLRACRFFWRYALHRWPDFFDDGSRPSWEKASQPLAKIYAKLQRASTLQPGENLLGALEEAKASMLGTFWTPGSMNVLTAGMVQALNSAQRRF